MLPLPPQSPHLRASRCATGTEVPAATRAATMPTPVIRLLRQFLRVIKALPQRPMLG